MSELSDARRGRQDGVRRHLGVELLTDVSDDGARPGDELLRGVDRLAGESGDGDRLADPARRFTVTVLPRLDGASRLRIGVRHQALLDRRAVLLRRARSGSRGPSTARPPRPGAVPATFGTWVREPGPDPKYQPVPPATPASRMTSAKSHQPLARRLRVEAVSVVDAARRARGHLLADGRVDDLGVAGVPGRPVRGREHHRRLQRGRVAPDRLLGLDQAVEHLAGVASGAGRGSSPSPRGRGRRVRPGRRGSSRSAAGTGSLACW